MLDVRTGATSSMTDGGTGGVGQSHDVWSLGCTLYELMTGSVLFEEE
eukprot:gene14087-14210_t